MWKWDVNVWEINTIDYKIQLNKLTLNFKKYYIDIYYGVNSFHIIISINF